MIQFDEAPFESIWYTPGATGISPSLSLEMIGGPKRYLRLWLNTRTTDWGWVIHESAIKLWSVDDTHPWV